MCSDHEVQQRLSTGAISDFEKDPRTGEPQRNWLVAIYKRAAAGEEQHFIRSKDALYTSWNWLKTHVIDSDSDFQSIY
jgi:hypothetical protein